MSRVEHIGRATLSGIYKIVNRTNGKLYVGSAVCFERRWCQHRSALSRNQHSSPKLQSAWNKYGPGAFAFEVIEVVVDKAALLTREQYWLDTLRPCEVGYNTLPVAGSRLGSTHSAETRDKLKSARARRQCKPCSPETKAKLSAAMTGYKRGEPSAEYRAKMSALLKGRRGRRHTPEQRAAISEGLRGKRHSPETRKKMAASQRARREREAVRD